MYVSYQYLVSECERDEMHTDTNVSNRLVGCLQDEGGVRLQSDYLRV